MRNLLILIGPPGVGKSTWVREQGLEQYVISPDTIRLMYSSPIQTVKGDFAISPMNDRVVWELLYNLVEERMKKGIFTVVDATHTREKYLRGYMKMAERYRVRTYYKKFDLPLEVILKQNAQRDGYKFVPEDAIELHHERMKVLKIPSQFKEINDISELNEYIFYTDVSHYNNVYAIGDIHGMYDTLKEFLEVYNKDDLFIFCGDYIDRGPNSAEVLKALDELHNNGNVILLEGNHEARLREWGHNSFRTIRNKGFLNETLPQLIANGIDQKFARQFYRKLVPLFPFKFHGKKFFVCHGGISNPENANFIPTSQLISGTGNYEELDKLYENYDSDIVMIHGHRNIQGYPITNDCCINLEGQIESGGYLRAVRFCLVKGIYKDELVLGTEPIEIKSTSFIEKTNAQLSGDIEFYNNHGMVNVKDLGNNIYSVNFKKKAFYNKIWNTVTIKARGLFLNNEGKVLARSYNKFFNIGERPETNIRLLDKKKEGFRIYDKYNGFLGIFSSVNGKPMFCSKSTNSGPFAKLFEEMANELGVDIEKMNQLSIDLNASFVFEVCSTKDPHIIDEGNKLVLLDVIENSSEFKRVDGLDDLAKSIGVPAKVSLGYYTDTKLSKVLGELCVPNPSEGYVIEFDDGLMVKYKSIFYNYWKKFRTYLQRANTGNLKITDVFEKDMIPKMDWYMKQDKVINDVIEFRKVYGEKDK